MAFTKNTNIAKIPVGATDWVSLVNGFIDAYEEGRTIKLVAGEDIAQFKAVTLNNDGSVYLANNSDIFLGIASNSALTGEDVFIFRDVGIEIAFGSWQIGGLIYLGSGGDLTQTRAADTDEPIGIAISNSSFVLIDKNNVISLPTHYHDDLYYTETEVDSLLSNYYLKSDLYNKTEIDSLLAGLQALGNQSGALGLSKTLTVSSGDIYYFDGFNISDVAPSLNIFQGGILQNIHTVAQVYFEDNFLKVKFLADGTYRVDAIISGAYKDGDIDLLEYADNICYVESGYVEDGYVECIQSYVDVGYVETGYHI
jgi:hypothetical protein